ncbi:MAG: type I-U CRISPR-associated helicase/endonuclease Cas3 [Microthrixaceae bacterium]
MADGHEVPSLSVDDFDAYFDDVHGHPPFGWQRDLLRQVDADRAWPELIDLPTGAGKTACLDVALFALALDAGRAPEERWAPRRIIMVVDRRVVVDQAHDRASHIASVLADGGAPAVAARLRSLSAGPIVGDDAPAMLAGLLRGGVYRDNRWAGRPDVPAILSATVDQVGSRLLFRGYGVSTRTAPIHAGLMGNDALFLLDEVHLSRPFEETLDQVAALEPARQVPARWATVKLSATPGTRTSRRFPERPLRSDAVEEVLSERLRARKPVELAAVALPGGVAADARFASELSDRARMLLEDPHVGLLGVVVNRGHRQARGRAPHPQAGRRRRFGGGDPAHRPDAASGP